MSLCCVEILSQFQSKLDFLQTLKVAQKFDKRAWTIYSTCFFKKWLPFLLQFLIHMDALTHYLSSFWLKVFELCFTSEQAK